MKRLEVRRGVSRAADARSAVAEIAAQIAQADASVAMLFVSPTYDLSVMGRALADAFPYPVLACTTSEEIGPDGYLEATLTGATIVSPQLAVTPVFLPSLTQFVREAGAQWQTPVPPLPDARRLGLLMLDGLSMQEDSVAPMLQARLGGIPMVGASAGDGRVFGRTFVYHDGAFHSGAGLLALVDTTLPFSTFMLEHFEPTTERLIITEAIPERRLVLEINGRPAATEYARIVGVPREALGDSVFAAHPMLLRVGRRHYVRSVQAAGDDDSLTFYAAIDVGLVLVLGRPRHILSTLRDDLAALEAEVPGLALIVGFDCVLRRQGLVLAGTLDRASALLARYPVVGMSTYGEQYNGVHANHTLTGWALGE